MMIRINTQINAKTTIYHLKHYSDVCLKNVLEINFSDTFERFCANHCKRCYALFTNRRGIVQDDPGPRHRPGGAFSR